MTQKKNSAKEVDWRELLSDQQQVYAIPFLRA